MEWQQLEYFRMVAELQHFTQAAVQLAISQPALSRSIASLEKELGVPLFDRQGRHVVLNEYGRTFLNRVHRVLNEMKEGRQELLNMLDPERGRVSLAFLKSLGISRVPVILNRFLQQSPYVQFSLFQDSTPAMLDLLEKGEVDFVLSSISEERNGVEWTPLWNEPIYVYVHAEHRLACKSEIHLSELAREQYIAIKQGYGLRMISDQLLARAGVQPNIVLEGEEIMTIVGFISARLGVSLLTDIGDFSNRHIVKLNIVDPGAFREIGIAWKTERFLAPSAQRFKQFLLEHGPSIIVG